MAQATAIETTVDEEEPLPADQVEAPDDEGHEPSIEEIAREMGWKPQIEYNGPPGKWSDAATFVKRGENILPIMRQQNRQLVNESLKNRQQIETLNRTVAEQGQILTDLRKMAKSAEDRGYQKALADLKQEQRNAVAAADTVAYEQVTEQIETLQEARAALVEPTPAPAPTTPQLPQEIQDFAAANPWWNKNQMLSRQMVAAHERVMTKHPTAPLSKQLELARAALVKDFPEAFPDEGAHEGDDPPAPAPRQRASTVAAPTRTPQQGGNRRSPGIDSIEDPEERKQCREAFARMKRQIPDYTEAEYMALYADPHADVLDVTRTIRKEAQNVRH